MILVNSKRNLKVGWKMADNQKMYAVLCGAIDEVIPFWNAFHRRSPAPARSARRWNRQKHSTFEAAEAPLCLLPQEDALGTGTQA